MGNPRPHGGPAEERDGHSEHHHRRPPAEGLGALHGPEEPHHIRRSVTAALQLQSRFHRRLNVAPCNRKEESQPTNQVGWSKDREYAGNTWEYSNRTWELYLFMWWITLGGPQRCNAIIYRTSSEQIYVFSVWFNASDPGTLTWFHAVGLLPRGIEQRCMFFVQPVQTRLVLTRRDSRCQRTT